MKKLFLAIAIATGVYSVSSAQLGVFNHLGLDAGVGTTGINVELSTPITDWLQLRGGVSIMPNITFNTDFDGSIDVTYAGVTQSQNFTVDVEGSIKRTQWDVLLNVYPFGRASSFFVAAGAYFGGKQIVGLEGHSNQIEELQHQGVINDAYIEVGNYKLDFEPGGRIIGGAYAKDLRPYLGIGFGRPCPKHRLGFMFELGVQFMGKMKIGQGKDLTPIDISDLDSDDTWQKLTEKVTVYPMLKFTLCGRIF